MKFKKNKKQNNRGFRGPGTNLDNKREGGREISCCNCIVSGLVQRGALADWKEAEEGKLPYQKHKSTGAAAIESELFGVGYHSLAVKHKLVSTS